MTVVRVVKIKNPPDWIVNATRIQRVPNYETLVVESNVTLTHSGGALFLRSAQSITIEGTISMYANGPYEGGTYWNYGKFASYQGDLAKQSSGGNGGNGALEYCEKTDCALLASGCTSGEIGTNGGGSGGHGNEAWMVESWSDHLVERRGGGGGSSSCGGPYVVFSRFTQELRFEFLTNIVECYGNLNSRFALEHRYCVASKEDADMRTDRVARYGTTRSSVECTTVQEVPEVVHRTLVFDGV